jgi:hypothetical protein
MNKSKIDNFGTTENHQTKRKIMRLFIKSLDLLRKYSETSNNKDLDEDEQQVIFDKIDNETDKIRQQIAEYFELENEGFTLQQQEYLYQVFDVVKQKYPDAIKSDDGDRLYIFGDGCWS